MKTPDFDRNRDNQLNDRNRLVQFLKTQAGPVQCAAVAKALGFSRMRASFLATKFPAYFVTWKEDQGKDRNTYIDLHHHLAMRRTA